MRIAIIKFGALGDVVRATCLLRPLKRQNPASKITWYTLPSAKPLLERNTDLDHIETGGHKLNENYDLVLSLDEENAACILASTLSTKKLFGAYVNERGQLTYTPDSRPWFDMGLLNRGTDGSLTAANALKKANKKTYPQLLFEMLKLPHQKGDELPFVVPDRNEERAVGRWMRDAKVADDAFVVGLNTSSGARWKAKQMSLDTMIRLTGALYKRFPKGAFVLLGGPEEKERNRQIKLNSDAPLVDPGTDNSLPRFISLINRCHALISSDSLAMHLGVALKKPVIAFFGPTSAPEIELGAHGVHWLPMQECGCFYKSECMQKTFCLDTLNLGQAMTRLAAFA